jgi:hypothetical protein
LSTECLPLAPWTGPPILSSICAAILISTAGSRSRLAGAFATFSPPVSLARWTRRSLWPFSAKSFLRPILPGATTSRTLKTTPASFCPSTFRRDSGQLRIHRLTLPSLLRFLRNQLSLSGLAQLVQLLGIELAHLARFQIQHQRTVPHATDLFNVVPDLLKHLAQLTVAPFNEHHLVPGVVALSHLPDLCGRRMHLARSRPAAINRNAFA